ncbi:PTS ascorbate transporter subunit IIC [Staphylococcus aureus]
MQAILNFIVDILSQPAILVALIAFIGLIVQKKPAATITSGTIKTILGFLILSAGADVVVRSLEPFGKIFQHAFGVQGIVPNNEAIVSLALKDFGTTAALIMVCGMIVNILIARFTNLKYIFLTGHHTFYMAAFLAIILTVSHIKGWLTIVIGALVLGLIMAVLPALLQPTMRKITGNDQVALGHFGSISYFAAGAVGQLFKGKSKSTEEIKFPKGLSFLRESTISISITMALLYFIACLFAGVRLILAEIVPAFKGISEKLVPNSKPALDCPIVFPYAQNAVLIGFFVSFITGVIGMFILFLFGGVVILPGVVAHFFLGATAAVFGNARGGIKGAVAGAALNGILITFLPLLFLPFLGELGGAATTFSDTDFLTVGIVFGNAVKYMGLFGAILFIIIVGATAILLKGRQKPQQ